MTSEEWAKVSELFHAASDLGPRERQEFLDRECGANSSLRGEVESLLAAESEAGDFIREPIVDAYPEFRREEHAPTLTGGELGHYSIERCIGSGGMGDVYLATDTRLNRKVAIKTLPGVYAGDPGFVRRFRNEAQAAATLNHPNVATIFSVEEFDGRPIISMEYVEGRLLSDLTPAGGVDIPTFLDWFTSISDALSHAHERGIVHRDIKPGNIMITADGTPKILDFGLAQMSVKSPNASHMSLTHPGQVLGTPSYMSPEQAEGRDVDNRSDIFSLGVVMFESLTGEKPFKGSSHAEIVSNLLKTEPPSVSRIRPEVPPVIVKLIERCLSKAPRSRFQSMREVNNILSELWATLSRGATRDSSLRRLYREFQPVSSRWLIVAGFIFVIAAAVAARFYFVSLGTAGHVSFSNMTFRKLSQANNVVYAHISPDGRSIAYNAIEEAERRSMWVRLIDDRNALQLLPPASVQFWGGMTFTSDSSQIYYITADWAARHGTLYRISSLGGQPRKLVEAVNDLGSLSPDGERLLIVRYGETNNLISVKSLDGSDERTIKSADRNTIIRDPQFSADGSRIFYAKVENVGRVERWSLVAIPAEGGDERTVIAPQKQRINELVALRDGKGLLINQEDQFSNLNQIFYVDILTGTRSRVTNDLNSYFGLSASADGNSVVTAERSYLKHLVVGESAERDSFRRVTREPTAHMNVVWTSRDQMIFDAVDNNVPHIWSIAPDGSGIQQLSPNNSADFDPTVSPDGSTIVFTSDRSGERKLWRMNADGSNPTILTPFPGEMFDSRFSSDGAFVYFRWRRDESELIGRVPAGGGSPEEMPFFSYSYWAFSNDGQQIAYALPDEIRQDSRIAVRRISESEPFLVTDASPIHIFKWTPDNKALLLRERGYGDDPFGTVWRLDLQNQKKTVFYSASPDNVFDIAISPDGRRIASVQGKLSTDAVLLTKIRPQ